VVDSDEFRYLTAWFDDQPLLGVKDGEKSLADGGTAQWSTFFGAEDLDKTLQDITDAGGTVLQPIEETPYGRLATASDPTGVTFNLSSLHS
jgi:uncharacterized protein